MGQTNSTCSCCRSTQQWQPGPPGQLQRHTLKTQGTNTTFFSNAAEHVLQIHAAVSQCENSPWSSPKQLQQCQAGTETQGGTVLCPAHLIAPPLFSPCTIPEGGTLRAILRIQGMFMRSQQNCGLPWYWLTTLRVSS